MNDMSRVIVPKSDQLNADDLISGPRTITITEVSIKPGTEQPVSIFFEGDENKPFKPCKSMCRVMVTAWGPDAVQYVGRSMTLYRDPTVKWGGMAIGGIRISHMSDIERDLAMTLTATKGKWAPYKVKPLKASAPQPSRDEAAPVDDAPPDDELREKADWTVRAAANVTDPKNWQKLEAAVQRLLREIDSADRADLKSMVVEAMAFHGQQFATATEEAVQ